MKVDALEFKRLLAQIDSLKIEAGVSHPITLIAVSKMQSLESIEELYQLGQRDFGENYVQELVSKAKELRKRGRDDIRWHFIGHLQTNKVNSLLPWVSCLHTLDSVRLASEVASKWRASGRLGKLPVFIEINIDREDSKAGVSPEEAFELVETVSNLPELELLGLMGIPSGRASNGKSPQASFKALADLELSLRPKSQGKLSMGMSGDYPVAIAAGATHIRIGTLLLAQGAQFIVRDRG